MWLMMTMAFAGKCTTDGLQAGVDAFPHVDVEQLSMLAAAALVEGCKLPSATAEGLRGISQVGPEQRPLMDMKMAAESIELWPGACTGGPKAVAEMVSLPREQQRGHLWKVCGLDDSRGFTEAEFTASTGLMLAPILLPPWLLAQGASKAQARAYARALAGISDRPVDNQVDQFKPLYPSLD